MHTRRGRVGRLSTACALAMLVVLTGCPMIAGLDGSYSVATGSADGGPPADASRSDATRADGARDAARHDTGTHDAVGTADHGRDAARDSGSGSGDDSGGDTGVRDAAVHDSIAVPDVVFIDAATCATGSTCIDSVPSGWSGPVILSDQTGGPPTPTPPACPSSYSHDAFDGYLSPTSPTPACGCSCGTLTGLTCEGTGVGLVLYPTTDCSGEACGDDALAGLCVGTGCMSAASAIGMEPLVQGGSCTPMPTSTIAASAWAETARACQPTAVSGGCASSQICVPSPPSPFSSSLCIFQAGSVSCPSGSYSQQKVFYASTTDTRACSPSCACSPPTSLSCIGADVSLSGSSSCNAIVGSFPADGTCHMIDYTAPSFIFAEQSTQPVPPPGATCTPSNPGPAGGVSPTEPTTLCCQP